MFRLAICDDDTLHMQNTLRCARETPEAADCDIRTFSAPGELMDAVTGGGYRPTSPCWISVCPTAAALSWPSACTRSCPAAR